MTTSHCSDHIHLVVIRLDLRFISLDIICLCKMDQIDCIVNQVFYIGYDSSDQDRLWPRKSNSDEIHVTIQRGFKKIIILILARTFDSEYIAYLSHKLFETGTISNWHPNTCVDVLNHDYFIGSWCSNGLGLLSSASGRHGK